MHKENWVPKLAQAITPGRGQALRATKNLGDLAAFRLRASECNGLVLMGNIKDPEINGGKLDAHRKKCALCKMYTNTFCLGCKRFLCLDKNRSKELTEIYGEMENAEILSNNFFSFTQTKVDQRTLKSKTESFHGVRSCYHIAHEKVFDELMQNKSQAPSFLDRVMDPPEDEDDKEDIPSPGYCQLVRKLLAYKD